MADIVGIDLGTTNSAVAVWQDGVPHIIQDIDGHHLTPSIIAIDAKDG
jgi:molecular chaperone DnaK (HSP70)